MLLQLQGELPLLQAARSSREPSCMGNMIHHVCSTATALTCTLCSAQRQTNSMCVDKLSRSALTRSMISTGCITPGGRRCTLAAWARTRAVQGEVEGDRCHTMCAGRSKLCSRRLPSGWRHLAVPNAKSDVQPRIHEARLPPTFDHLLIDSLSERQ